MSPARVVSLLEHALGAEVFLVARVDCHKLRDHLILLFEDYSGVFGCRALPAYTEMQLPVAVTLAVVAFVITFLGSVLLLVEGLQAVLLQLLVVSGLVAGLVAVFSAHHGQFPG